MNEPPPPPVKVLYFGQLHRVVGLNSESVAFANHETVRTVGDIFEQVTRLHPALAEWKGRVLFAVESAYAKEDERVLPGQELAIMPPVQGG